MAADVSKIDPSVSAWSLDDSLDIRNVPTLFEPPHRPEEGSCSVALELFAPVEISAQHLQHAVLEVGWGSEVRGFSDHRMRIGHRK